MDQDKTTDQRRSYIGNYRLVVQILVPCAVIMAIFGICRTAGSSRRIVLGIAAVLVFAILLQVVLVKINPRLFGNKNPGPDEES